VANPGDLVKVHYVGVAFSTGEEFDASWDRGEPPQFELGAGPVIAGWDQGVQGMNVGGRRQLIIPPGLAYGDWGAGRVIAPGETAKGSGFTRGVVTRRHHMAAPRETAAG
jgi:peptidylprolyl isomerase